MTIAILIVLFFAFTLLGMPISISIGASAIASIIFEGQLPGIIVPQRVFVMLDSFSLMAVPLFILSGELMTASGITANIVKFASTLVGHFRAGLAQVSILSSMIMAGVSGSASADASAIGSIMIPAMIEDGYDKDIAVAITASANTIGPIIPPSIMMIIYGSMTSVSIGAMFLGGIVPGILFGFSLMGLSYYYAVKRGYKARPKATLVEMWNAFKQAVWALIMPFIILGGILSGIFTATEAGAIAVAYAFTVGFLNGKIKFKDINRLLKNAAIATTIPMFIIGISSIFGWILARNDFPQMVGGMISSISSDPNVFIIIIVLFLLFIGLFMEANAAMIIMTPIVAPLANMFGFNPVHFGVVTVVTLLIGTITPPVGILLFIASSIAKIKLSEASKTIWPFVGVLSLITLLIALVPEIVMFVPNLLMGTK